MTDAELHRAIADLARIDAAGWLADLEHDLADWLEPPIDPFHGVSVKRLARDASRILGVSPRQAERAAIEVLAPTRKKHALDLIAWYVAGLAEQQAAQATDAKLAQSRRRGR